MIFTTSRSALKEIFKRSSSDKGNDICQKPQSMQREEEYLRKNKKR